MKVGIFRNTDGACDLYRASLPIGAATNAKKIESSQIWASNLLFEVSKRTDKFMETMSSDIYLLQRLSGQVLLKRMREFAKECGLKTKVVIDHDDDVFNVSPMSNHYVDYGTQEIKIVHNGKLIHEWKDGVNIDIKANIHRMDDVKETAAGADLITVTTEKLAQVFRPYNPNVKVLPNCVDLPVWNRLPLLRKNPDEVRICWAGGHSHWEDLFLVKNVLVDIAKKYPNIKIVMVGYKPVSMEKDFKEGQLEYHDWVETPAHPYRMATLDIDIAIIPLKDTPFNNSKSSIKWVEFSALQVPCVSSNISPYAEMGALSPVDNGIYIENNALDAWVEGLSLLIESKDLREGMGYAARKTVEENFDINKKYQLWIDAYEEILGSRLSVAQ